jgi:hypothetical protein
MPRRGRNARALNTRPPVPRKHEAVDRKPPFARMTTTVRALATTCGEVTCCDQMMPNGDIRRNRDLLTSRRDSHFSLSDQELGRLRTNESGIGSAAGPAGRPHNAPATGARDVGPGRTRSSSKREIVPSILSCGSIPTPPNDSA